MTANKKRIFITSVVAVLIVAALAFSALSVWIYLGNSTVELNTYSISSNRLPKAFDGYRIAHVSDLHNAEFGNENRSLIDMLSAADPDIIVITGDMIDSRNTKPDIALNFIKNAMDIAPCYYVSGNHEARVAEYNELEANMLELGVIVLANDSVKLECEGETVTLIGIQDPAFFGDTTTTDEKIADESLNFLIENDSDEYKILLSHRPELFEIYKKYGIDLVFSGHSHGGQFRLPFIGGVAAPDQGLFPKYDGGIYSEGNTSMVVSRGIGNSIIPIRLNNRPEIILTKLNAI